MIRTLRRCTKSPPGGKLGTMVQPLRLIMSSPRPELRVASAESSPELFKPWASSSPSCDPCGEGRMNFPRKGVGGTRVRGSSPLRWGTSKRTFLSEEEDKGVNAAPSAAGAGVVGATGAAGGCGTLIGVDLTPVSVEGVRGKEFAAPSGAWSSVVQTRCSTSPVGN